MVIIVFGLPGSGKSYFASRLAKMIHAGYVNSDQVRKKMFSQRTYTAREKMAVYNQLLDKMKESLQQRRDLVVDGTFFKATIRDLFAKETHRKRDLVFIEVCADEDIIRERLKKDRPYSEADFDVYKLIKKQWEPMSKPHLLLESTNENIDEMLGKAVQYLQKKR